MVGQFFPIEKYIPTAPAPDTKLLTLRVSMFNMSHKTTLAVSHEATVVLTGEAKLKLIRITVHHC